MTPSCPSLTEAILDIADLVEAATERTLLVSVPLSLSWSRLLFFRSAGTLRGTAMDSKDGVDDVEAGDGERRSGVEMDGVSEDLARISGVDMGVGVLL